MWEQIKKIKYYAVAMLVLYGVFTWAGLRGQRFLGDDTDSREAHTGSGGGGRGARGSHGFYHK